MSVEENEMLGPFAVVLADGGKGPVPLRGPSLKVIAGREFVCGIMAFKGEYWLNGTTVRIPLERTKGIYSFSSEQAYLIALEQHNARERKGTAEAESGGEEATAEG